MRRREISSELRCARRPVTPTPAVPTRRWRSCSTGTASRRVEKAASSLDAARPLASSAARAHRPLAPWMGASEDL